MPSDGQILDVLREWSGSRPGKMSQSLKDWWDQTAPGSSHSSLPFDSDGIDDLLTRLKRAFPSSPVLSEADFRSAGSVQTVQDLCDALETPVAAMAFTAAALKAPKPAPEKKAVPKKKAASKKKAAPKKKAAAKKTSHRKVSTKSKVRRQPARGKNP